MPLYFFDIFDGTQLLRDEEGSDLPDLKAARDDAVALLPDLIKSRLPEDEHRRLVVTVRDESGAAILQASLSLDVTFIS
ncbi:DUF6894 family protein [Teichococcus vastitatis]|uniref:DUF6894 domain-containing protein n=1 Tax=Teichococcus vastitatis TaxID=2307076 RepID=A0ABS9W0B8_9PROT|nr:hypothetical protein [Pseudoroseomonas vastitatis]MCI0752750.1 hypothetical protein [Pseudoroseomonas vastitatis]